MIDLTQYQEFLPVISGFLGGATSAGLFAGPIQTLQDWWYVNYGHNISDQKALLLAKQEANVEKLKIDILKEVSTIPPENVQEPSMKILGPAIEASRYYIDEEELRNMFAKIIASSLDNRMSDAVHSSFVEIIKQLDVLDAMLLSYLKRNNHGVQSSIPTMKMVVNGESGTTTVFPLIFLSEEFGDFHQNAVSLINLDRLGIITLREGVFLTDEAHYDFIKHHETISYILTEHPEMVLEKSCFSLTDFGQNFINACVV